MTIQKFRKLHEFIHRSETEMQIRAKEFYTVMNCRRTVRDYSDKPVPRSLIENAILTAGTAPSGANRQPWHFTAISAPEAKAKFRKAAEAEEQEFYAGRASDQWLADLEHLGTDAQKPFLEIAPWLIVCFRELYGTDEEGNKVHQNYYIHESAGIACGMLIAALHNAGLATLTHTPSPMQFLNELCGRPKSEKPMMILVAGYPADDVEVPDIGRKSLDEIANWIE